MCYLTTIEYLELDEEKHKGAEHLLKVQNQHSIDSLFQDMLKPSKRSGIKPWRPWKLPWFERRTWTHTFWICVSWALPHRLPAWICPGNPLPGWEGETRQEDGWPPDSAPQDGQPPGWPGWVSLQKAHSPNTWVAQLLRIYLQLRSWSQGQQIELCPCSGVGGGTLFLPLPLSLLVFPLSIK